VRRIRWRTIGWLAALAFLALVAYEVFAASKDVPPPPPGQQPVILKRGHVTGNRISSKSWSFDYERVQTSPDGSVATIDGVKRGVLYKHGKPYLTLAAQHVTVNTQTFDFTATGQVHIEDARASTERRSFDTDLVQWVNATKMLTLPHTSLIRTGDQVLKVDSITVDFNKTEIRTGPVHGGIIVH
jgi:hypothetical protein